MLLALIVAVAILVAALMALLSQLGGAGGGSSASSEDVGKLYSGIPQNGTTLGKSSASVIPFRSIDVIEPLPPHLPTMRSR